MPKKYNVQLTAAAQADIQAIYNYIAKDNPANAVHFILEIEAKVTSLDQHPYRQPAIPENSIMGTDYRHLIVKKYRVIYRVAGTEVFIMRIVHGTRLFDT